MVVARLRTKVSSDHRKLSLSVVSQMTGEVGAKRIRPLNQRFVVLNGIVSVWWRARESVNAGGGKMQCRKSDGNRARGKQEETEGARDG